MSWQRILGGLIVATAGISSAHLLLRFGREVTSPRDLTIPEGSIVYSIRALAHGHPLYRDFRRPPYATAPYTPFYYSCIALLCKTFTKDINFIYICARSVTFACTVASLILVTCLSRRVAPGGAYPGLLGLFTALTVADLRPWGFTCRVDVMAVALSLGGLKAALSGPNARRLLLAAAFFIAALFTKQSSVAAPLAIALALAHEGRRKHAIVFLLGIALASATSFAALDFWTGGRFGANVLAANLAPIIWWQPTLFAASHLATASWPVLLWIGSLTIRSRRTLADAALSSYALISFAVAILLSAKAGADRNYFIEAGLAMSIMAGRGWLGWMTLASRWKALRIILPALGLLISEAALASLSSWFITPPITAQPSDELFNRILRTPGPILFGDAGLAVRFADPPAILDKFNASYLHRRGLIDFSALSEAIENRIFVSIILEHPDPFQTIHGQPWWPEEVALAIDRNYRYRRRLQDQYEFLPRPKIIH